MASNITARTTGTPLPVRAARTAAQHRARSTNRQASSPILEHTLQRHQQVSTELLRTARAHMALLHRTKAKTSTTVIIKAKARTEVTTKPLRPIHSKAVRALNRHTVKDHRASNLRARHHRTVKGHNLVSLNMAETSSMARDLIHRTHLTTSTRRHSSKAFTGREDRVSINHPKETMGSNRMISMAVAVTDRDSMAAAAAAAVVVMADRVKAAVVAILARDTRALRATIMAVKGSTVVVVVSSMDNSMVANRRRSRDGRIGAMVVQ